MNIDYDALLDTLIKAKIASSDPQMSKLLAVFTKRGISVFAAMPMLMEIAAIAEEMSRGGNEQ